MTSGDLQALRELLGFDYKKCQYVFGSARKRGTLRAENSTDLVEGKDTALLIRLLLNYPQFFVAAPEESAPDELIQLISTVAEPGAHRDAGKVLNPDEMLAWFEATKAKALRTPSKVPLMEVLETGQQFVQALADRLAAFTPLKAGIPLPTLTHEQRERSQLLLDELSSRQRKTGAYQVHLGRLGIILGKRRYSSYAWGKQGVRLTKPTQWLLITVMNMIQDLGREGLQRYLLIVDEDAYAEGAPEGLMTYFTESKAG